MDDPVTEGMAGSHDLGAGVRPLAGEVHVWPVRLHAGRRELSRCAALLSEAETARAARLRFEPGRDASIIARAALRLVLGAYLAVPPAAIAFAYAAGGKPRLADGDDVHFNLSHSGGMLLIALTQQCEIGVDVEAVREIDELEGIAGRFFAAEEHADLMALPADERQAAFFRCWTRKEAFVKALGAGLLAPFDRFRVSLRPGEPARLLHVDGAAEEPRHWTLCDVLLGPEYAGALAYRAGPLELVLMESSDAGGLIARFA